MKKQSVKLQVPDDVAPQVQPTKFDGVTLTLTDWPEVLDPRPGYHIFRWNREAHDYKTIP